MDAITGHEIDSDRKFWLAFEQATVGVALISPMGRYLRANPKLCRMLGYSEEQLNALTLADTVHPEDAAIASDLWNDLLSGEDGSGSSEMRFLRRDGQVAWAGLSMSMVRDESGLLMQAIAVVEDISGRKEAQMELEQAGQRYQAIWDTLDDFVSINNRRGDILVAGGACARLTGYAPAELLGTSLLSYVHPDDRAAVHVAFKAFAEGSSEQVHLSYRALRKDGSYALLETTARPFDGGEHVREIICVSRMARDQHPEATKGKARSEQGPGAEVQARLSPEHFPAYALNRVRDRSDMDDLLAARVVSRRSSSFPFGVLLVDIDNFAALNNACAGTASDVILNRVARALQETCREDDTVGRAGGDQFLVMLPNTGSGGTIVVGERLVHSVRAIDWSDLPLKSPLTISVGGTCVTYGADLTFLELMSNLHDQLKLARERGRDRLVMNARHQGIGLSP
jgi:diguanylate cyclase (GGDEF)-like protein/PAS domain S-box-containing protein